MYKSVLLIDVDATGFPNLALMKASAYYKKLGFRIYFWDYNLCNPKIIVASNVFSFNKPLLDGLKFFYPKAEIHIGGSGYDLGSKLPKEIEFQFPDYDLYPRSICDFSLGYTSRGCDRSCGFCIVPTKEGAFQIWQHPAEFYDERFDKIVFLDNNILLDKEWFHSVMGFVHDYSLKYWFTQGLDIRLLDERDARVLREETHFKMVTFAWDWLDLEPVVREKLKLLEDAGFNLRSEVMFYVYVDSDEDFESGLYRVNTLRELNVNSFLMFNVNAEKTERIKQLTHWANRKCLFWKCEFKDYNRNKYRGKGKVSLTGEKEGGIAEYVD